MPSDFPDDYEPQTEPESPSEDTADAFVKLIQQASEDYDKLCLERHEAGKAEYGAFTFLENDVVRMMMEELADTSNYCRMQYIKLMILQHILEEQLNDKSVTNEQGNITIGIQAFRGAGKVGWVRD